MLENSSDADLSSLAGKAGYSLGLSQIPEILIDNTDRNRTSPFAFTGNRFEFRAVGSSANCASAMIALNAAVADQLDRFHSEVNNRVANGMPLREAILSELRKLVAQSKAIHFDGNGYSDEWKEEAARRGLDCTGVFSKVELQARNEVKWEMYTKKIQLEARVLGDLALNHIVPVARRYQSMLVDNVVKLRELYGHGADDLTSDELRTIENIARRVSAITRTVNEMVNERKKANAISDQRSRAIAYHDTIAPALNVIRRHADKLELLIDNEMWPLPKYRELLFIR